MRKLLIILSIFTLASCSSDTFPNKNWYGKHLTLVEMMGTPVQTSGSPNDAHLIFNSENSLINGSGGCNRITGEYEIDKDKAIRFSKVSATRMACQNMNFESRFLDLLDQVRYYDFDEETMLLQNGRKETILKLK
ncbi:META domain-containing protein [Algoriphagus halophytocola]|uniref:META domain-containing protein n=1 Tax=Algoriphagus halophytocola TaxID=2991499 RepID=A0ABY6MF72_9BACT|nr:MULTISPECIES: META domain-containing protein [unclassified Algoriphagus]UZD21599.1 META domain-containing protein [Algoriphagus sp. TR-M5]WBL42811.1 META domain-containing protein [Algoriphagus sp. TR-M9]